LEVHLWVLTLLILLDDIGREVAVVVASIGLSERFDKWMEAATNENGVSVDSNERGKHMKRQIKDRRMQRTQ
jgi:hypothetical protein